VKNGKIKGEGERLRSKRKEQETERKCGEKKKDTVHDPLPNQTN
jgi:hypothetical protein